MFSIHTIMNIRIGNDIKVTFTGYAIGEDEVSTIPKEAKMYS